MATSPTKLLRTKLIVSTAILGGIVAVAPARAQTLPDSGSVTTLNGGTVGGAGPTITVTPDGGGTSTMRIDLKDNRTILNWAGTGFNIGAGNTVNFADARAGGLIGATSNIAVLNRDLSGAASNILGNLTSDANVQVYLINANGIMFGSGASINTGSLFASTRDVKDLATGLLSGDAAFLANGTNLRFAGSSTAGITITTGANFVTKGAGGASGGRLGDLIFLGGFVNATGGSIKATGPTTAASDDGDAAFVAADDLTVSAAAGSPLALTITRGTAVSGAMKLTGTVQGRNVTVALASRGSVADTVLSVGGMVTATGAVGSSNGVVLTAGSAAPGVTLAPGAVVDAAGSINTTGATIGSSSGINLQAVGTITTAGLTATGAVTAKSGGTMTVGAVSGDTIALTGGSVSGTTLTAANGATVDATGNIALTGGIAGGAGIARLTSTAGDVGTVNATGANVQITATAGKATVSGDVTASAGDYSVTGDTVALGGTGTLQQATGKIDIHATGATAGTGITSGGTIKLLSNSGGLADGGNTRGVRLTADTGAIAAGGFNLFGGPGKQSMVTIIAPAPRAVTVGNVDARALIGLTGRQASIGLGNVAVSDALTLATTTGPITTGNLTSANGITVTAVSGNLALGDVTANGGDITLTANAGTIAALIAHASGSVTAQGSAGVTLAGLKADTGSGEASSSAGGVTINGNATAADTLLLKSGGGDVVAGTAQATNVVTVDSSANARIDQISSSAANVKVTATGSLTGRVLGVPIADGRFDPAYGRTGLSSATGVSVVVGPLAQVGTITRGTGTASLTADEIDGSAAVIDVDDVTARTGRLSLTATSGLLQVRTLAKAGGLATLTKLGLTDEIRLKEVNAGSATIASATKCGVDLVTTLAGNLNVTAGGAVTGLLLVAPPAADGLDLNYGRADLLSAGNVTVVADGLPTVAGNIVQLGRVTHAVGGTADVAGSAIDVKAGTIDLTSATAKLSTLRLVATVGDLKLGTGSAATTATLLKTGGTGELIADTLTAGTLTGSTGDVLLDSSTSARLGNITSQTGTLTVTAPLAVTGLRLSSPATDGRLDVNYGRANLTALNPDPLAMPPYRSILVSTNGLAQLGTAVAGLDLTVIADRVDATSLTATTRDLTVTANGGALILGTGVAGNNALTEKKSFLDNLVVGSLSATNFATAKSSTNAFVGSITVTNFDAVVSATGLDSVSGNASAGRDYLVTGASVDLGVDANAEIQSAAGKVVITSTAGTIRGGVGLSLTSNLTGLADPGRTRSLILDATGGDIAFDTTSVLKAGPARESTVGIDLRTSGRALTLGTVAARELMAVDPTLTVYSTPLSTSGEIAITDLTITNSVNLGTTAGSIRLGNATVVAGDLNLAASGSITGLLRGTPATDGRLDLNYDRANLSATGIGRSIMVTAGASGLAQLGTVTAGLNVLVTGQAVDATSLTATGGLLNVTANGKDLIIGSALAGTTADVTKTGAVGELVIGTLTSGNVIAPPLGTATIKSDTSARLGTIESKTGDVKVTAFGGSVTGMLRAMPATDGRLDFNYDRATLLATATGRSITVTTSATGLAQLGTATAGLDVVVTGQSVDATSLTATSGLLKVTANGNDLIIGGALAGTTADVTKTGNIGQLVIGTLTSGTAPAPPLGTATIKSDTSARLGTIESKTGDLNVTAVAGAVTGLALATPATSGATDLNFGRATLTALATGRSMTVSAGTLAQLGAVKSGLDLRVTGQTVDASILTATSGLLNVAANGNALTIGDASAGTTADVTKTGATGELTINTLTSGTAAALPPGTATITSATAARLGTIESKTGDVKVTATAGAVTGLKLATPATSGATDLAYGRTILKATAADRDITVNAGGLAQIDTGTAARDLTIVATAVDATTLTATARKLDVTASVNNLLLGTGTAGTVAVLTKTGATGTLAVATKLTAGTTATATSDTSADIREAQAGTDLTVTAKNGDLRLGIGGGKNTTTLKTSKTATLADVGTVFAGGASPTALTSANQFSLTASNADIRGALRAFGTTITVNPDVTALRLGTTDTGFALSLTELNRIDTSTLTLDGKSARVEIGDLALGDAVGSSRIDVLTLGDVLVSGAVAANGTNRTLRIGGGTAAGSLAGTITIQATATAGGRILVAGDLDLRAGRIAVGQSDGFLDQLGALTVDQINVRFVSNTASRLYLPAQAYSATQLIKANTLKVSYTDYALFQNTGIGGQTKGVDLGFDGKATPTLVLVGSGASAPNSFAMFGTINGRTGSAAALLGPGVISVTVGGTTVINLAQSRVNGCLIGSAGGCLPLVVSLPPLTIFDASQANILGAAADLALTFDPLVGSNNETLFADPNSIDLFGPAPVGCPPNGDKPCPNAGAAPQ